jgi:hypothetical protein
MTDLTPRQQVIGFVASLAAGFSVAGIGLRPGLDGAPRPHGRRGMAGLALLRLAGALLVPCLSGSASLRL